MRFLDWTVDGEPVRDWFAVKGFKRFEITWMVEGSPKRDLMISENRDRPMVDASLMALLPDCGLPLDRDVHFNDGRVAILYCDACGELSCGALTAEVRATDSTVQWRNLTYQDATSGEFWPDMPRRDVTFERSAYEATVRGLLTEWERRDHE
ncbi:hypothetical protein ABA31_07610 [Agrococcus baldri]|uniref:Uncharacterized protein n=2 Tax=Agrococcus baldri TaxID=153730 RepID=A0AA87URE7_9MICO|nr:hypothetical protein ABA31_07610 [Agrococcus baldri]